MSDPLDRLTEFGSSFEGGTMPKSAAEVRARGDQIRRRRQGLLASGAAAVVAAVAIPVLLTGGSDDDRIDPAPRPDRTTVPLSTADLMLDSDTEYQPQTGWATARTTPGDGQAVANVCQQESLAGLGATAVFERDFHWVDAGLESYDGPAASYQPQNTLNESIAEFATEDEARTAYDQYAEWLTDCSPPGSDRYDAGEPQDVEPGVEGEALTVLSFYGPVPRSIDQYGNDSFILETGLVVTGNRVAVLSQTIVGQDYNFEVGSTPVARMIPKAAERLLPDVPVDTDLAEVNLPTSEDAVFFSDRDWVEESTTEGEGEQANPCLDHAPSAYGALETWRRDFTLEPGIAPEDEQVLAATASEFSTPRDARVAYQAMQDDLEDCEQSLPDVVPGTYHDTGVFTAGLDATGGQGVVLSVAYAREDALDYRMFLDTGLAVVGNRLLVVTQLFAGQDYLPEPPTLTTLENAAPRLAGATPTEQETGEAGSGLIPEGFPLDAGWPAAEGGAKLEGPSHTLPSLEFTACDATFTGPTYLDRLRANWIGEAEDSRARQLSVYADVDTASAAAGGLAQFFRDCGTGPVRDDGYRTEYEVRELDVADEAWAILQRDTLDGAESTFGQTTVVVRDATSVLILDHGGHAGYPSGDGEESIQFLIDEAAEVIATLPSIQDNMDDGAVDPDAGEGPDLDDPAGQTTVPDGFPIGALGVAGISEGPARNVQAVAPNTICGQDLSIPTYENTARSSRLEYHEATEAVSDGRMVAAYPTVQAAVDTMEALRAQLVGCGRDNGGDGLADRVWTTHQVDTGYDSVTFSWTYEEKAGVGAPAGVLYTVTRVGNAIVVLVWQSEGSTRYRASQVADQLRVADAIAPAMCIFTADGC